MNDNNRPATGVGSYSEAIALALGDAYSGYEFADPTFEIGTEAVLEVRDEELERLRDIAAEYDRHALDCRRERIQLRTERDEARAEAVRVMEHGERSGGYLREQIGLLRWLHAEAEWQRDKLRSENAELHARNLRLGEIAQRYDDLIDYLDYRGDQ